MGKRVALITLHAVKNYGSVLQTYATQTILESFGYDSIVVNYIREFNLDKNIANKVTENDYGLKKMLKNIVLIPTVERWKCVFNTFLKQNIKLTDKVYTYEEDFKIFPINADIFCVGSDQVWNTEWNGGIVGPLYLDFINHVRKISFSSSVGVDSFSEKNEKIIKPLLDDFIGLTVREKSSISILDKITNRKVTYCCDPTLLLDSVFWSNFISKSTRIKEPYILLIQLNRNKEFDDYAVSISKKKNMKLIRLCMRFDQIRLPGKAVVIPTVQEYLSLIQNANIILTDSFHATAFSINFNKDFIAVYPGKFNSRIEDILENCGLRDRKLLNFDNYDLLNKKINYNKVNKLLKEIRRESINNIRELLIAAENGERYE